MQTQKVVKIDTDRSLIYVQGNVPGAINGVVKITDATRRIEQQVWDMYYPTFIPGKNAHGEATQKYQIYDGGKVDPWEIDIHENDVVSGAAADDD